MLNAFRLFFDFFETFSSRQAELKQEYDNLQSELKSMANVGKESMMGAGDAAKEFLEQEKERLEKRKRNLEVQLKTIIDHRKNANYVLFFY